MLNIGSSPGINKKLLEYGKLKTVLANEIVINEHAYIRSIPIVVSGSIRVLRSETDGREILIYYIKAGESCIMSLLGCIRQDTSKITAIAEEDTEILFIPIDKVNVLIREFPEWLEYIFKLYHNKFEELLEVVNAIAFTKLDERLIKNIKTKCELKKTKTIQITHNQLASELGTARVVVSRLLKQMELEGLIALARNKITLL